MVLHTCSDVMVLHTCSDVMVLHTCSNINLPTCGCSNECSSGIFQKRFDLFNPIQCMNAFGQL